MNIILCIDDKNGYSFAGRRQSKDRIQLVKMLERVGKSRLFVNNYSSKIFDIFPDNLCVTEDFLNIAELGDFCFIENIEINDALNRIEKVIIYRWNRVYPSDMKFSTELLENRTLISTTDFVGSSHDKITEEVYE